MYGALPGASGVKARNKAGIITQKKIYIYLRPPPKRTKSKTIFFFLLFFFQGRYVWYLTWSKWCNSATLGAASNATNSLVEVLRPSNRSTRTCESSVQMRPSSVSGEGEEMGGSCRLMALSIVVKITTNHARAVYNFLEKNKMVDAFALVGSLFRAQHNPT